MIAEMPVQITGLGMDRRDYESELYISQRTTAYHRTTGRHPTAQEVIDFLDREKNHRLKAPDNMWNKRAFVYRSMTNFLAGELIRIISSSLDPDPIRVIYRFMNDMDDISVDSDCRIVWDFAAQMRDAAQDIVDLL